MWKYLQCFCSMFYHSDNFREKQALLHHDMSSEGMAELTAEKITNEIIKTFNHDLAQEIAGLFAYSDVNENITMRDQVIDLVRMRSEMLNTRARSYNKITAVERENNIMYIALGQSRDSNIQLCISKKLYAKLPKHIIINLQIKKTERADEQAVVNLIIKDASLIKQHAMYDRIPLNLLCKIAIKTNSILLQLIDETTQKILVEITKSIPNSRRDTFSCDERTVSYGLKK
jgi:hypothetical protein